MNILDENVPEGQLVLLRRARIPIRQIGDEVGRAGMKDHAIIPLLHELDRPTLFTLDSDFYDRRLRHEKYCLVHLDIDEDMVAEFVRRLLRHSELNTKAKAHWLCYPCHARGDHRVANRPREGYASLVVLDQ